MFCINLQTQNRAVSEIFVSPYFQNYAMKEGLSANYIWDVEQDAKGYIWLATPNGVMRYGGNEFIYFQEQSENTNYRIASNQVIDLCKGANGDMFINTIAGLLKYDAQTDRIIRFRHSNKGWGKVLFNGKLIFLSSWNGIEQFYINNDSLVLSNKYKESFQNTFLNLIPYEGKVLSCVEERTTFFSIDPEQKTIENIKIASNGIPLKIASVCNYGKDIIALGTINRGVFLYNIKSKTLKNIITFDKRNVAVKCMVTYVLDGDTLMLAGTENEGLWVFSASTKEVVQIRSEFGKQDGLLSNRINSIVAGADKGLWVGTDKGLSYFHPSLQKRTVVFLGYEDYNNVEINCAEPLDNQQYLIGTDNFGLIVFDKIKNKVKQLSDKQLKINYILHLEETKYLLATNRGVFNFELLTSRISMLQIDNSRVNINTFKICKLNDKLIGLCTEHGAWIYDVLTMKSYFKEKYIGRPVQSKKFCKDMLLRENKLWILRFFDGVNVYDLRTSEEWDITPLQKKEEGRNFYNFTENGNVVYVSTSSGIIAFEYSTGRVLKVVTTNDGLLGNNVYNVLYSTVLKSLVYSNIAGVYTYSFDTRQSKPLFYYDNYSQKWIQQFAVVKSNELLCTVSDYFVLYKINLVAANTATPSLTIQSLKVNNKPHAFQEGLPLELNYTENSILLKFDALVYPEYSKNRWFYTIAPEQDKWLECSNGLVSLNNMPPGEYELYMFSVNNEGLKSERIKIITLNIKNPFYNTVKFYVLIFLIILSLIFVFLYLKYKQRKKLEKVRNQISRDLHDDLGSSISAINIMSKMLNANQQEDNENAVITGYISRYSVEISNTLNDIIWNINPRFDSVSELIRKMVYFSSNMLESKNIEFQVTVPEITDDFKVDNETKYNFYLIFKELINNLVKHSGANNVKIEFSLNKRYLSYLVEDDGKGFENKQNSFGNGLSNMKNRALQIGAVLEIESAINRGTSARLTVKLK